MPIRVLRLNPPEVEAVAYVLRDLASRDRTYSGRDRWTAEALVELPDPFQAFVAADEAGIVGLLVLSTGLLETWGAPTDLLGANPIVPVDQDAAAIHSALLQEASAWVEQQGLPGMEILLPMGRTSMSPDPRADAFFRRLGFRPSYYAMMRQLTNLASPNAIGPAVEIVPAASLSLDSLFVTYAACTDHGEIELIANQSALERRAGFDEMIEATFGHPGTLALLQNDQLIGCAFTAAVSDTSAHLAWMGVIPEYRRQGLGRQLLHHVLAECRGQGLEELSLYTDVWPSARSLYRETGFSVGGTLTYRWRVSSRCA